MLEVVREEHHRPAGVGEVDEQRRVVGDQDVGHKQQLTAVGCHETSSDGLAVGAGTAVGHLGVCPHEQDVVVTERLPGWSGSSRRSSR